MTSQTMTPNQPKRDMHAMASATNPTKTVASITALIVALFLSVGSAFAQGTIMPAPVFTGLDASGNPLVSGKLCTYVAGTSTPATTYTTSALNVANANPVILSSAGRAIVFLRPGSSYKFVLYSAGSDTTCNTGTLQWSSDNISALPTSNVNLDLDGTAGESLSAGDVVYLSDGSGSRTQGSWYKTDADFTYASSEAPFIGMVPSAIASGASGTVRIKGVITLTGPLTSLGSRYWINSTAGAMQATPPNFSLRSVGVALTATTFIVSPDNSGLMPSLSATYLRDVTFVNFPAQARCSLTTAVPVTTADVTAATTVYYTPYLGNTVALYTGSVWRFHALSELSIAVPNVANQMYDLFIDFNDGTPVLSTTAWTNDTTRATALVKQDGIFVKTGDTQMRYACSFRTTAVSGQTEDSFAKRLLWNYYNRVDRQMRVLEATDSWNYSVLTWRQARATATNQIEFIVGVAEVSLQASVTALASNSTGGLNVYAGIGLDSTTAPTTGNIGLTRRIDGNGGSPQPLTTTLQVYPAVGYHYAAWLEASEATLTTTFYGDNGAATFNQAGITGRIPG